MRRLLAGIALAGALGAAAWQTANALQNEAAPAAPRPAAPAPSAPAKPAPADPQPEPSVERAATPMAQRIATLGLLNKRNGISRDLKMRPGQAVRVGDVIVRLRACEKTAPWESQKLTGAFVQTDVRGRDQKWRRAFSGWLFKESPSLNVVEHPVYDVWPKSCEMRHPDIGPDTLPVSSPSAGNRSIAKKSPGGAGGLPKPSAASNNPV
jgi:hypothetical protein